MTFPVVTLNTPALVAAIVADPEALHLLRAALGEGEVPSTGARPYMTSDEAADYLRCGRGRRRIYELVAEGRLTRHGQGRLLLLSRKEVEALARGSD